MHQSPNTTPAGTGPLLVQPLPFPLELNDRLAFQESFNRFPALIHLGARVDLADPHWVHAYVDEVQPYHRGGMGGEAVNGALLAALFDCALGVAGVLHLGGWKGDRRSGTIEMSVKILRSVFGSRVIARSAVVKKSKHIAFASGEILDETGRICATATAIAAAP